MRFVDDVPADRFDRFVDDHPLGTFQQCSDWGRAKTRRGGTAHLVGVESDGDLAAATLVLSLPFRKHDREFLWAPRGFVVDYRDDRALSCLAGGVRGLARERNAVFARFDPFLRYKTRAIDGEIVAGGEDNSWMLDALEDLEFGHTGFDAGNHKIQPRHVMWLDLDRPLDEIWNGFHQKTRYNVRVAERSGVEVVEGGRDDLPAFERIMRITGERDGFRTKSLGYFEDLHDALAPSGRLRLFLARCERETVAGSIAVVGGGKVAYLYGASDNVHRERMPNHLLQWRMIEWAKERGATLYDFRGSGRPDPASGLHGLFRFKRGFRGEYVELIGEFDLVLDRDAYEVLLDKTTDLGGKQKKLFKELRG